MSCNYVCHVKCCSLHYIPLPPFSSQEAKISSTCMRTLIFLVKPLPKKTPPVPTTAQETVDGSKEEEKEAGQAAPEEERAGEVGVVLTC